MKPANRKALDGWIAYQHQIGRTQAFMDSYVLYMTNAIKAGERRNPNFTIDPPKEIPCPNTTANFSGADEPPAPAAATTTSRPAFLAGKPASKFASGRTKTTPESTSTESASCRTRRALVAPAKSPAAFWR